MFYLEVMMGLNHPAVFVAALAAMAIGMLWYSPALFGTMWMELAGISKKDMEKSKKDLPKIMFMGLITMWVMAYVLGSLVGLSATGAQEAAVLAFWIWLGFQATIYFGGVLWEKQPLNLFFINAAHSLVMIVVMAIILASWV